MTKKDYIMIADALRPIAHDCGTEKDSETSLVIDALCAAFKRDNPAFKEHVFRGYIKNECGPSGGKIR